LEATHRPPPSSGGTSVADEDARMPKTHHPYLTATLGEAALRLPPELAQPLEAVAGVGRRTWRRRGRRT